MNYLAQRFFKSSADNSDADLFIVVFVFKIVESVDCSDVTDAAAWNAYLDRLGKENVTTLLIEGGGTLAASALAARVVDRIEFHIAPKILGGSHSRPSVGGEDPLSLDRSIMLRRVEIHKLGADIAYSAALEYPPEKEA